MKIAKATGLVVALTLALTACLGVSSASAEFHSESPTSQTRLEGSGPEIHFFWKAISTEAVNISLTCEHLDFTASISGNTKVEADATPTFSNCTSNGHSTTVTNNCHFIYHFHGKDGSAELDFANRNVKICTFSWSYNGWLGKPCTATVGLKTATRCMRPRLARTPPKK